MAILAPEREVRTPDGRPVDIRSATEDDAAPMLAYLRRAGAETPFLSFGAEGLDATEAQERATIAQMTRAENAIVLVAVHENEIVGVLTFAGGSRARLRHTGEVGISVVRDFWGSGVGRTLLELLLAWAEASTVVRKIDLRVRADNARAIALYERLGFAVEGRTRRAVRTDGEFHDTLCMGRLVDPRGDAQA